MNAVCADQWTVSDSGLSRQQLALRRTNPKGDNEQVVCEQPTSSSRLQVLAHFLCVCVSITITF